MLVLMLFVVVVVVVVVVNAGDVGGVVGCCYVGGVSDVMCVDDAVVDVDVVVC